MSLQDAKRLVRSFQSTLDQTATNNIAAALADLTGADFGCYLCYPWRRLNSLNAYADEFWAPLRQSFQPIQRREDIFFAGVDAASKQTWVVSMGHYLGLFDRPWLDIPATRKIALIRYAEFYQVSDNKICDAGLFVDVMNVMSQAGVHPLPNETGRSFVYPGPRTHDGILDVPQEPDETHATAMLLDEMIQDLDQLNQSGEDRCPPELLAKTWRDDMLWYGPTGIGASYTIPRYQEQHQFPFREGLKNKVFKGHVCRVAEGHYAGFFGWPNLVNTAKGGFLGLPANEVAAEMQVVDIYRREGNKLAENWVFIDIPYWLKQQGLDVFERLRALQGQP